MIAPPTPGDLTLYEGPENTNTHSFILTVPFLITNQRELQMNRCFLIETQLDGNRKTLEGYSTSRVTFVQWLGAEVSRVGFDPGTGYRSWNLSRERLIRRLANFDGASHPRGLETGLPDDPLADTPIHYLMQRRIAGLALPYLVVLHTAQEIIKVMGSTYGSR